MWGSIQSANATYKAERWRWRKELYKTELPASALRVGLALIDEWGRNKDIFPSFDTIAEETGMKRRAVICGIEALHDAGLIATHKTGIRDSLRYFLISRSYVFAEDRSDVNASFRSSVNTESNLSKEPDEFNLNAITSCDGAPAVQDDLPSVDHPSFDPVGSQGAEVPRQIGKERRSA